MQMIYPREKGPVWIDWKGAADGGLRVVAMTDDEGEPWLAAVEIDRDGEMKEKALYDKMRGWCTTRLFKMPDGTTQLWRFTATVSPDCLLMKAKPVPFLDYDTRAVAWSATVPTASF
jgi:hypothetical protein